MKKTYLLMLLGMIFNNLQAQNFNWAKREGMYAYDYGYGIANDNAGNVYVAGKYEQNANFSGTILPNQGNHDIYLAKYDASGALSWVSTGGGGSGDYAHALAYDGANNVYVAGEIEYYPPNNVIVFPGSPITLIPLGSNDAVITKYDLNGNLLWAKSGGGYYNDKAQAVTCDNAGNVYVSGFFTDTAYFGSSTIYGKGNEDIFVAKYDMNGVFQWVRNAGGSGRDEAKSMKCDAAGNVYVCGMYNNGAVFGTQTYTCTNLYAETFLAKYSPGGALLWVKTAGGAYDDVAWSLTMDNAGMIYVTGEFNASAYFGATQLITSGNADVFVTCYDASGNVHWAKRAGGPYIDRARGIGCDGTNIFITGQFGFSAGFGSGTVTAPDSSDIFFASMDNAGNFIRALSVGGVADSVETLGYESGIAICAEASGNVYATGSLLNGGTFGSTTLTQYSRTDVFITKISQLTGVNTLTLNNSNSVILYPNPTSGNVTIGFDQIINQKIEMSVFNCYGQIIDKRTEASPSKMNIDLSKEESGVYFIELKLEDQKIVREKIIVQK